MSLYEFLFNHPFPGSARHEAFVKERRKRGRRRRRRSSTNKRLRDLEEDLGFLTLTVTALVHKIEEKQLLTRAEIRDTVNELDDLDGVREGRLDVGLLKDLAGWVESRD
jgi:hypothetical protein